LVPTGSKNQLAQLTVTVDPTTGAIQPITSESQFKAISTGQSGGTFLDKAIEGTLGSVSDWIDGDPIKAAALFYGGAALAPEIGAGTSQQGAVLTGAEAAGAEELTAQQVSEMIAAEQASSMTAAETLAAIEAEQAASAAGAAGAASAVVNPAAAGLGALDYVKAGLLANAITGDPLGLGGGQPEQAPAGSTGFQIVPVPAEWKSPTYAPSAAPIDLESIFSNQNMLGGTQWQDLPSQRNMSFNDIFAAGQQQTPMGTPVDINQIVGSILGQTATR
jgi:hypothetical protein